MDNLWDVSYVSVEGDADGHQADSQETGSDNMPIELGTMETSDESDSEDSSSQTMQPTTAKPNVRSSAASVSANSTAANATPRQKLSTGNSSAKATELAVNNANVRQPETQSTGSAKQNATAGANASEPQSEMREDLNLFSESESEDPPSPNSTEPYDHDETERVEYVFSLITNFPEIRFHHSYTIAEEHWARKARHAESRLARKARPFTEIEHMWEQFLKYANHLRRQARDLGYRSRDAYLKTQKAVMLVFAMSITPRMLCDYVQRSKGAEHKIFFEALIRINGGKLLPKK